MQYAENKGKNILLGITGSIAAYKAAFLVRLFVKGGYNVRVVMTKDATAFISPLTMSTLSKNKVAVDFATPEQEWNNHVELGIWADVFIIAPATANTIAKMSSGIADNLLLTAYLSARCPVMVAPAMDLDMWRHPATQQNIATLKDRGVDIIDVDDGELASGLQGEGRMSEPQYIFEHTDFILNKTDELKGKNILITAGPTVEDIDPVRFISNRSTGKMGFALAEECARRGANVTLVSGPVHIPYPGHVNVVKVRSAQDMYEAVMRLKDNNDIFILAAAVADFTPAEKSSTKIKKKSGGLQLKLKRTPDIAAELGKTKKENQIITGFALESDNEKENALRKLKKKNFDFIVLNSLKDRGAGFAHDTNKVTLFFAKDNKIKNFELKSKRQVAKDIVNEIVKLHNNPGKK